MSEDIKKAIDIISTEIPNAKIEVVTGEDTNYRVGIKLGRYKQWAAITHDAVINQKGIVSTMKKLLEQDLLIQIHKSILFPTNQGKKYKDALTGTPIVFSPLVGLDEKIMIVNPEALPKMKGNGKIVVAK